MGFEVDIVGVTTCECPGHSRVVLRDGARNRKLQVRVSVDAGQALLAELAGIPSSRSLVIDLVRNAVEAAGGQIEQLTLGCRKGELCARLLVRSAEGSREVEAEPCDGLLTACRMGLPVFIETTDAAGGDASVPEVYRAFVESLDLSGLRDEAGT